MDVTHHVMCLLVCKIYENIIICNFQQIIWKSDKFCAKNFMLKADLYHRCQAVAKDTVTLNVKRVSSCQLADFRLFSAKLKVCEKWHLKSEPTLYANVLQSWSEAMFLCPARVCIKLLGIFVLVLLLQHVLIDFHQ